MAGKLDLEKLFKLHNCDKCKQMIVGRMFRAAGKTYHDTCFRCMACGTSLENGYQMDETRQPGELELPRHQPHCPDCYSRLFMPTCKRCGKNIAEKAYVQACKGAWHEACFVCSKCGQDLASGVRHWPVDDQPYCEIHYMEANLQKNQAKKQQGMPKSTPRQQLPPQSFLQGPTRKKSFIAAPSRPAPSPSRPAGGGKQEFKQSMIAQPMKQSMIAKPIKKGGK